MFAGKKMLTQIVLPCSACMWSCLLALFIALRDIINLSSFRLPSMNGTKDWTEVPACLEHVFTAVHERCYEPLKDHYLRNFSGLSPWQILYGRQIPDNYDEITTRASEDFFMSLNNTCSMSRFNLPVQHFHTRC